ncbi:MAG: DUF3105 domain-containing protein [Armatimonadota bacterium]|nr:DUF3105 domain-containing protein [Armatimonadota bacterium]
MTQADKARKDAKRQRRQVTIEARRAEQHRREAARRRRSLLIYGGSALAAAVVVALIVVVNLRSRPHLEEVAGQPVAATPDAAAARTGPGAGPGPRRGVVEQFPGQGGDHLPLGQAHPAYNSNPPTSGWHTPQTAPWGVHRTAIPDEVIVHNLEHGGIWISYRDASDAALIEKLETLVARYRSKVILTPRPQNDAPVAVAAWTRLMKLDGYDEEKIVRFIDAYKNKGPERVPD